MQAIVQQSLAISRLYRTMLMSLEDMLTGD